jgi:hypothetical protein
MFPAPRQNPSQPELFAQIMQQIIVLVINVIIPEAMRIMRQYNIRVPYHTSILRGKDWVDELLNGHPKRIRTCLGVDKHVFEALVTELQGMGHGDSRYISLQEQLAIFLYACVTGLPIRHLGERFQRSNETISK